MFSRQFSLLQLINKRDYTRIRTVRRNLSQSRKQKFRLYAATQYKLASTQGKQKLAAILGCLKFSFPNRHFPINLPNARTARSNGEWLCCNKKESQGKVLKV